MNVRKRKRPKPEAGVNLAPLIDCVFLLLIFFLVTSMIKRFERQIPVTLSDNTSAITPEAYEDSYPIGVDNAGILYSPAGKAAWGMARFEPLADSEQWLQALVHSRGGTAPVTVVVERGTPFQKVINVQDRLELIGFENIRFRLRDFPLGEQSSGERRNRR